MPRCSNTQMSLKPSASLPPDEKYGECVQAAVVLSGDCEQQDIQDFCRERLADFKVPDVIYFTDELPRTATGKIQRRHVSAAFVNSE